MESGFIASIISELIKTGTVSEMTMLWTIMSLLLLFFWYFFKPMADRIKKVPTIADLKNIVQEAGDSENENLRELSEKLDGLIKSIEENINVDRGSYREVKDLSRDLEHVKQILNQIQGHFMYRGSGNNGNQELR